MAPRFRLSKSKTMYNNYFGLTDKPFSIAPDPRYLFMSDQHREALAHLVYGVGEGGGFVLLTGEVGTGKTTVCRCLLEQIPESTKLAFILNPKLSATELLANACDELQIEYPEDPTLKQLSDALNQYLIEAHGRGQKTVLMIDEAQNLSSEVLEQIRLLTNLETNKEKLLQIILIGQPELKELLGRHELRQLSQRITARFHLEPLTEDECHTYVQHRLEVSGFRDTLFDDKAVKELYHRTGGVPRLINVLCDRAMLGAYAKNRRIVDRSMVRQAANEVMGGEDYARQADVIRPRKSAVRNYQIAAGIFAALMVGFALYAFKLKNERAELMADYETRIASLQQSVNGKTQVNAQLMARVTELEAELNAKPESLLPFLPAEIQPTSRLDAQRALMARWQVDYLPSRDGDACDHALLNQLRCESEYGNWQTLAQIDRPVIMKLLGANGLPVYGVLLAMDNQKVLVNFAGEEMLLDQTQLSPHWDGEYQLLWQAPPNYQQPLSVSMRGIPVQWLMTNLAKLDNLDLIVPPNAVYDNNLKQRVERFQAEHNLTADGVAGPQTIITLNNVTGLEAPTLSTSSMQGGQY